MKVFKAVRGMNFIAVVMYRSQQRSRRGQRIVTSQVKNWHRVYSGLLRVGNGFFREPRMPVFNCRES